MIYSGCSMTPIYGQIADSYHLPTLACVTGMEIWVEQAFVIRTRISPDSCPVTRVPWPNTLACSRYPYGVLYQTHTR